MLLAVVVWCGIRVKFVVGCGPRRYGEGGLVGLRILGVRSKTARRSLLDINLDYPAIAVFKVPTWASSSVRNCVHKLSCYLPKSNTRM